MNTICPECKHEADEHSVFTMCNARADCNCTNSKVDVYRLLLSERDTALEEARKYIEYLWEDVSQEHEDCNERCLLSGVPKWLAKYGGEQIEK